MLPAATRLGNYEIVSLIGAGGMGEVYRARDANLGREVAIKILPPAFSSDPERLARFRREAQVLASLNHPHIATVHGLEGQAGAQFLVMEMVSGETLERRIASGPLPVPEALAVATQLAEALEAAHDKGIVHRDLKRANIAFTHDGQTKVLDFGLAKLAPGDVSDRSASLSPTITSPLVTGSGVLLGTAAYMAPEQARGREADKGADIWAFGCVLFEMLTGERAFKGADVTETIASIIRSEPNWTRLPAETPSAVRLLLRRCLEKDRARRLSGLGAVSFAIADLPAAVADEGRSAGGRRIWAAATGALLVGTGLLAGFAAGTWRQPAASPAAVHRERFVLSDGLQFTGLSRQLLDISPDGTQIVFAGNHRLYLRPLANLTATAIPGTEFPGAADVPTTEFSVQADSVMNPVFSPEGDAIAFYSDGYKRIATKGGAPTPLLDAPAPWGMSWDERWIIIGQGPSGVIRVADGGGQPETIARVRSGEMASHPQMLPGRREVLVTIAPSDPGLLWERANIVVQGLEPETRKLVIEGASAARYVNGHVVFAREGILYAAPFDIERLTKTGPEVPVIQGVRRSSLGFTFGTRGAVRYRQEWDVGVRPWTRINHERTLAARVGRPGWQD